jgi:uncharacterized protein YheU (UPF0270 family)
MTSIDSNHEIEDGSAEKGVIVPLDRMKPETLRNLVVEFVTREWSDLTDTGTSLETKVEQVLRQLKEGKVVVVFDLTTETCNLVQKESLPHSMKEESDV